MFYEGGGLFFVCFGWGVFWGGVIFLDFFGEDMSLTQKTSYAIIFILYLNCVNIKVLIYVLKYFT